LGHDQLSRRRNRRQLGMVHDRDRAGLVARVRKRPGAPAGWCGVRGQATSKTIKGLVAVSGGQALTCIFS